MKEMTNTINHFSHEHVLKLYKYNQKYLHPLFHPQIEFSCNACHKYLNIYPPNPIYGCKKCAFFLHFTCAKSPQKLHHPFHPQHSLSLLISDWGSERLQSNACGDPCWSGAYHCNECKFCIDRDCSELQPFRINEVHDKKSQWNHQEHGHGHPLFACDTPPESLHKCSNCLITFSDKQLIYVCADCKTLFHEWCILPAEMMHPFHLEHSLALQSRELEFDKDNLRCNACSGQPGKIWYRCSSWACQFTLDLWCASLKPTRRRKSESELPSQVHPHPLIECNLVKKDERRQCFGCQKPIEDSVYVCLKCGFVFDKFCTQLLPEITHPFHPLHPLKLVQREPHSGNRQYICRGCDRELHTYALSYVCHECDFRLHPGCASTKPYAMIKTIYHDHPIALLTTKPNKFSGYFCRNCVHLCDHNFFRCVECYDFNLHLECYPLLPKVLKHDCHCDPLTFTRSRIKAASDDDSEEEYYCHACEDLRDLEDPTYFCKQCYFVAHPQCVLSAILQDLEAEYRASLASPEPSISVPISRALISPINQSVISVRDTTMFWAV